MSDRSTITYTNWATTVSDKGNTNNCVYTSASGDYKWNLAPCTDNMNFVCYSSG